MSLYVFIFTQIYLLGLIDYLAMKVGETEDVASELSNVVSDEQVLLQECADLLHQAHDMQVWFHYCFDLGKLSSVLSKSYAKKCLGFSTCYAELTVLGIPQLCT